MHKLKESKISLENLYFDPNNPRYIDITGVTQPVREERVAEESVQKKAFERIMNERFDVSQLKDSIRTIGFLPVDRLAVVELPQRGKYMVVEGNRRLAALKSLKEDFEGGEIDLVDEIKKSINTIPVLIIEGDNKVARDHFARILQGVRHVASIKAWGPYQQAQIIVMMLDDGKSLSEIKETLGLSAMRINSLRRSFYGLKQMQQDPDYKEHAKPDLFSHFEEAYKQQRLRTWINWDDETSRYMDEVNRKMFYSWCVPYEEDGQTFPRKVEDAKELRQINRLMDNPALFKQFCDSPTLRLPNALQGLVDNTTVDWRGILNNNLRTLRQIPAVSLLSADTQDIQLLKDIESICEQLLQQVQLNQNATNTKQSSKKDKSAKKS